ncbi:Acyl-CoA dehydrogenase/oxidase domain protein [Micrococcus lylae]|uniref:Acyl-CoA dehydrogenase/oxidase domain protein n=1 Tax=Micrococcus lylae TaxID=1273 RepID=A0A1R4JF79_9MICC|nr:acyl-CoA dehydrogenase family protein [Micrococcus lylae]SJN30649.1 Acyl-CoA dehydrogenase/oxidase domain protein [Micrococcus lylae]
MPVHRVRFASVRSQRDPSAPAPSVDAREAAEERLLEALAEAAGADEPVTALAAILEDADPAELPLTGAGRTRAQWEILATLGARSLAAARVLEPHLDALSILAQADVPAPSGLLGVYASESGGVTLTATRLTKHDDGSDTWRLDGTKPWCSLAADCTSAVVTARREDDGRPQAFLVDLRHPGVDVGEPAWPALGLRAVTTGPVAFDAVPAVEVGGPEWYLQRPGFAWGGIGVAACWFGGAVHAARTLRAQLHRRQARADEGRGTGPDQIGQAAYGRVDRLLRAAAVVLGAAADAVDAGELDHACGMVEADRVRGTVAQVCTEVLQTVGEATGPGPLTQDAGHAQMVADLQVYLRQHHGDRDDARLGAALLEDEHTGAEAWW